MENKTKTEIRKMTFSDFLMCDPDSQTPLHDEIQIWCWKNMDVILKELWPELNLEARNIRLEFPLIKTNYVNPNGVVVGFLDLYLNIYQNNIWERIMWIEVKSKILSLGALIRQINFYNAQQEGTRKLLVVSPDIEQYREVLNSQGILTYQYVQDPKIVL